MEEITLPEGDVMKKYRAVSEEETMEVLVNNSFLEVEGEKMSFEQTNGNIFLKTEDSLVEIEDIVRVSDGKYMVHIEGYAFEVEVHDPMQELVGGAATVSGEIKSPMAGVITSIAVEIDQKVSEGDVLLVLSAMKMENEIVSPVSGTITSIECGVNEQVNPDQLLVVITEE